ncbi:MAG TPA: ketosteroid isomerase-related protein [Hyphomicrobiales bacterium]|nr:ketosteroid isomerase-related protein [Hyphomicrobiales bacterium]
MTAVLEQYYQRFNAGDYEGMLALLADDVVHEPSQGNPRHGKALFREFLQHMERCYQERVIDPVFMGNADGERASAEFMLEGRYLVTDGELPPARGQGYTLRVGAFFDLRDGKIARVSNHYNLEDWIRQVSAGA